MGVHACSWHGGDTKAERGGSRYGLRCLSRSPSVTISPLVSLSDALWAATPFTAYAESLTWRTNDYKGIAGKLNLSFGRRVGDFSGSPTVHAELQFNPQDNSTKSWSSALLPLATGTISVSGSRGMSGSLASTWQYVPMYLVH